MSSSRVGGRASSGQFAMTLAVLGGCDDDGEEYEDEQDSDDEEGQAARKQGSLLVSRAVSCAEHKVAQRGAPRVVPHGPPRGTRPEHGWTSTRALDEPKHQRKQTAESYQTMRVCARRLSYRTHRNS